MRRRKESEQIGKAIRWRTSGEWADDLPRALSLFIDHSDDNNNTLPLCGFLPPYALIIVITYSSYSCTCDRLPPVDLLNDWTLFPDKTDIYSSRNTTTTRSDPSHYRIHFWLAEAYDAIVLYYKWAAVISVYLFERLEDRCRWWQITACSPSLVHLYSVELISASVHTQDDDLSIASAVEVDKISARENTKVCVFIWCRIDARSSIIVSWCRTAVHHLSLSSDE